MKLTVRKKFTAKTVVIPCFQDQRPCCMPEELAEVADKFFQSKEFEGKAGTAATLRLPGQTHHNLVLAGMGKEEDFTAEKARRNLAAAIREVVKLKAEDLDICFDCFGGKVPAADLGLAIAETALLTSYKFDTYISEKKPWQLDSICLVGADAEVADSLEQGQLLAQATLLARRLVNEPANVMTPAQLACEAEDAGKEYGFDVSIYGDDKISALGMKAFAAVARASEQRPRLIVMRYSGNPGSDEILGLVGKGLTYDSGGLSIKPTAGMSYMKCDMGGAASVIGAMSAIAASKLKLNVTAVVAACENLISGSGYKPGDIIGSMSGKTIEVLNTDAEGRLTLADAVHYTIHEEKATRIVDVATLTGAAVVALGKITSAVVTNDDNLYVKLEQAAEKAGERVWRLPGDEEYKEDIKSEVADLKNTGQPGSAGTIAGALFVGSFTGDVPWLHLDIAGTAWTEKEQHYQSKGGTGVAVRTLFHLANSLAQ